MQKMTETELEDLVASHIHIEGYTDLRSIYYILRQEYPGQYDRNRALQIIHEVLTYLMPSNDTYKDSNFLGRSGAIRFRSR